MKTVLIFEPQTGGHRANYIRWLAAAIEKNPPAGHHFIFVIDNSVGLAASARISLHPVPAGLARRLAAAGSSRLSRLLRHFFDECLAEHSPDHALILELTRMELSFALYGARCPVSAILFVQYPEMPRGIKFLIKDFKTALMLRRAPVRNLFLLNGEEACRRLACRFKTGTRFIPVPDPVPQIAAEPGYQLRSHYRIDSSRTVFLFFGAVSRRKGADVLIQALHLLSPEAAAKSAFIFCGAPEPAFRERFRNACAGLSAARPDILLNTEDRFVSDERMMALFEQSDAVLMPYTRPEYSSGILALAAGTRTPVIGPDSGLLGRLILSNGLGTVCPVRSRELAETVARAAERLPELDETKCAAFIQKSRPEIFALTILEAVRDGE